MASPSVSVVTPFHNTAPYLAECIESVLAQTHVDLEYILVDNQSTDGSTEIAQRYAAADARIRFVRTERLLTQVQNYNYGLSLISSASRWCKLAQADDWIDRDCLARMIAVGDSAPRVGLVAAYTLEGSEVKGVGLPPDASVVNGRDACRMQLLEGRFFFGSPTAVLYRASIVRDRKPFYQEGRLHEDTELGYELLRDWDFGFVHQVLAFLRVNNGGVSSRAARFNPNLLDKYIVVKRFGRDFLSEREFERVLRDIRSRYDLYIGESVLRRREPEFWRYHLGGLESMGERLTATRLALATTRALAYGMTHPIETLRRALAKRRG